MYLEHMLSNYIFVCFYKYYPKLNKKKKNRKLLLYI